MGVAILRSPRIPDDSKPRTLEFDVQFWVSENDPPLTARLRYVKSLSKSVTHY